MTFLLKPLPYELWESQGELEGRKRGNTERCVEGDGEAVWGHWVGKREQNSICLPFIKVCNVLLVNIVYFRTNSRRDLCIYLLEKCINMEKKELSVIFSCN